MTSWRLVNTDWSMGYMALASRIMNIANWNVAHWFNWFSWFSQTKTLYFGRGFPSYCSQPCLMTEGIQKGYANIMTYIYIYILYILYINYIYIIYIIYILYYIIIHLSYIKNSKVDEIFPAQRKRLQRCTMLTPLMQQKTMSPNSTSFKGAVLRDPEAKHHWPWHKSSPETGKLRKCYAFYK